MVLQKAPQRATVWGYAGADDVGSLVTVQLISGLDLSVVSTHQATIKAGKQFLFKVCTFQNNVRILKLSHVIYA